MSPKRKYDNSAREAQAEETKNRILDAVAAVLENGLFELTMPAVAKAAGVSLPTVYRHFSDKRVLIEAAAHRVREQLGVRYDTARSMEELVSRMRHVVEQSVTHRGGLRILFAAIAEPYAEEVLAGRLKMTEAPMREALKNVRGTDRKNAVRMTMVLLSSPMAIALARFGITGREAADLVEWTVDTLMEGVRAKKERA